MESEIHYHYTVSYTTTDGEVHQYDRYDQQSMSYAKSAMAGIVQENRVRGKNGEPVHVLSVTLSRVKVTEEVEESHTEKI